MSWAKYNKANKVKKKHMCFLFCFFMGKLFLIFPQKSPGGYHNHLPRSSKIIDTNHNFPFYFQPLRARAEAETVTQWLKITQNVTFLTFFILAFITNFLLLKLTCLATLFDLKLKVLKNSSIWPFLAILMNFWPVKM